MKFKKNSVCFFSFFVFSLLNGANDYETIINSYPLVIGRGGYGEIRKSPNNKMVIKLSKKSNVCKDYQKEYKIHDQIYKVYSKFNAGKDGFAKQAQILKPEEYKSYSDFCFFKMPLLRPIKGDLLYQVYLGEPDDDRVVKRIDGAIRGHYLGFKQISDLVNSYPRISKGRSNIEQLCYEILGDC